MARPTRNTTHERIADSVLALINSRPRSPTKAELMACLAGWELIDSAGTDTRPGPEAPRLLQPTRLGLEIIELLPEFAEASWHDIHCDDPADDAAVDKWYEDSWGAMVERYKAATNLVDLAIAQRAWRGAEATTVWHADTFELYPEEVMADRLCAAILKLAGIDEASCHVGGIWRARGWDELEPTAVERDAALVKRGWEGAAWEHSP